MRVRHAWLAVALAIPTASLPADGPALRRPVAVAIAGDWLLVANSGTGTISIVDPAERELVAEVQVAASLSALEALPGARRLLATDPVRGELLLLEASGRDVTVAQRVAVAPAAASVRLAPRGDLCAVSSVWARRVAFFRVVASHDAASLVPAATADLGIAPREGLFSAAGELFLAADAFGGELDVIETATGARRRRLAVPGHNIRGLAVGPRGDELLIAHQILDPEAGTTHGNVFWGQLMGNAVRMVELGRLFGPGPAGDIDRDAAIDRGTHPLGQPGNAAGDPGAILVTPRGHTLVCLTGTGEVALQHPPNTPFSRVAVGRGPTALALRADGLEAYVADRFDDTISIIDLERRSRTATLALGARREPTLAERGEELFHDARLSLDGWYSCHSCHTDGHTNGLLNDGFADGTYGTPKRVPSLLGAGDTTPWAWNGGMETLEEQVRRSIVVTMQGMEKQASRETVTALAAYLRTLAPPPSVATARSAARSEAARRGGLAFAARRCDGCHEAPAFTTQAVYDVDLEDEKGLRRFNPPSLRGVSQRGPYLHDGSAATLRELLATRGHPRGETHEGAELDDLLAFLESL